MSKVKVTADAAGNVIVQSKNNPEYGYIRVLLIRAVVENGFTRRKPVSALVQGTIEDLKAWGWKKDQELEGTIIFKEQLTPFNKKDPDNDLKIAGETKIRCVVNGDPIYRKSFYVQDNTAKDVLIAHTNGEEIKAAFAAIKAAAAAEKL